MTKVKICGLTNVDNAIKVAHEGVDAIGLVFYDKSPRSVDIKTAEKIIDALPPFVNRVALFVNAKKEYIDKVIQNVAIDTIQFHGDEQPSQCELYHLPYIKAIRVDVKTNLKQIALEYKYASGLLLDAKHETLYGGSGEIFDWDLAKVNIDLPIILAGGLNMNNVKNAIDKVNPYAVDISSSVEKTNGIKDINKVRNFMEQVK